MGRYSNLSVASVSEEDPFFEKYRKIPCSTKPPPGFERLESLVPGRSVTVTEKLTYGSQMEKNRAIVKMILDKVDDNFFVVPIFPCKVIGATKEKFLDYACSEDMRWLVKLKMKKVCRYYAKGENCPFGEQCYFSHSEVFLRPSILKNTKSLLTGRHEALKKLRKKAKGVEVCCPYTGEIVSGCYNSGDRTVFVSETEIDTFQKNWTNSMYLTRCMIGGKAKPCGINGKDPIVVRRFGLFKLMGVW